MRKLFILWGLLFLLAITMGAQAVEYRIGSPISLSVKQSARTVTPGQVVTITLTASDRDMVVGQDDKIRDQPEDPVSITWEASGGKLSQTPTIKGQPTKLTWTSPPQPGYYAVFLTVTDSGRYAHDEPVRRIVEIDVKSLMNSSPTAAVRVSASPQTIRLDRSASSTITAQVLGAEVAGKEVNFFTTAGTLSASRAITDAHGIATVRLTAKKEDLGTAEVAAYYGNTNSTTTVEIVERAPRPRDPDPRPVPPPLPSYAPQFTIGVNPPTLPADGRSTAMVEVRITDARGLGIRAQHVDFQVSFGRIQPRTITDLYGVARVQLFAPDVPGIAVITAQAGALRSYTTVTYTPVQPAPTGPPRLFLTVTPNAVPADGTSRVDIGVLALDSTGRALANAPINFSSTLGLLTTAQVLTNGNGQAGTTLVAPANPGVGVISARLDGITAATQVVFQGPAVADNIPTLDMKNWTGQQMSYVADRWLTRRFHIENGANVSETQSLIVLSTEGKLAQQFEMDKNTVLVFDQNGLAHGYATEKDDVAKITVLTPDGEPQRSISLPLTIGSHLVAVQYADPSGQVLVTIAKPDGTGPEVYLYGKADVPVLTLKDGLVDLPLTALGGDGYLALALAGGSVRLYNPEGQLVAEMRRADGLPATHVAVGAAGTWVAVASALAGQTKDLPRLVIFSREGTAVYDLQVEVTNLVPADAGGVLIATPANTGFFSLASRKIAWTLPNGFTRALAQGNTAVFAGFRDAKTQALIPSITVVRLSDGKTLAGQTMDDLLDIRGILPIDASNQSGVVAANYVLRFTVPGR